MLLCVIRIFMNQALESKKCITKLPEEMVYTFFCMIFFVYFSAVKNIQLHTQIHVYRTGEQALITCYLFCITYVRAFLADQHAPYIQFLPQSSQKGFKCTTTKYQLRAYCPIIIYCGYTLPRNYQKDLRHNLAQQ